MTEISEPKASCADTTDTEANNPANASLFNMRRELVCTICYENYNQLTLKPVSLVPCGHSVCSKCVEKLEKKTCPTCKEPFSIHIFNWAVIGLLPKPTVDEIKSQVKRSIEENGALISEVGRLTKLTCFEAARKDIEEKHAELVNELQGQKRELLNRINSIEKKCGIKSEIVDKVQKDMKQFQAELAKTTNEISESRLSSMIKILQLDIEQLQESAKNIKRISIEPPLLRFRPHSPRMCNMIGDLTCELEAQEPMTMADRRRARIPDLLNHVRDGAPPAYRTNSFLRNSVTPLRDVIFGNARRRAPNDLYLNNEPPAVFNFDFRTRLESPVYRRDTSGGGGFPEMPVWQHHN